MSADLIPNSGEMVAGVVGTVLSLAWLARNVVRRYNRDIAETTKDRAEGNLYTQLSEQLVANREMADEANRERYSLVERVAKLEAKLEQYEDLTKVAERLKEKLDAKDKELIRKDEEFKSFVEDTRREREQFLTILAQKDEAINTRDKRLSVLETKLQEMELRLTRDERTIGIPTCPFQSAREEYQSIVGEDKS